MFNTLLQNLTFFSRGPRELCSAVTKLFLFRVVNLYYSFFLQSLVVCDLQWTQFLGTYVSSFNPRLYFYYQNAYVKNRLAWH